MCGIIGFLEVSSRGSESKRRTLQNMAHALRHRGPDGEGAWQSADGCANLGHRRLSIIDLTPTGSQPMRSADGRLVLSYNGEIYNFGELRAELEAVGCRFRGSSDTEVLLCALAEWGIEKTLPRLNGMFAFALWDERTRLLYLARDRFGEKPLYYGWHGGVFLFGSELKGLAEHPAFRGEVDREAMALYMRFNYVPWPYCIYKDTWKLGPGHFLVVALGQKGAAPKPYWTLAELVERRQPTSLAATDPALVDLVEQGLKRAIKSRMVSDVPLGAFLSGGIDSSTVVALMQAQSTRPIKTFTIGFWEAPYNEAEDAAKVARHLGTEHHELYLSSNECLSVIARLPTIYDEPFADSSQIPTTLVSEFTRRHVTVALSGDGGDEFFGGYNRYFWTKRLWPRLARLPLSVRQKIAAGVRGASPARWDVWFGIANRLVPSRFTVRGGGEKLHKLARALDARSTDDLYQSFVSQWEQPEAVLLAGSEPPYLARKIAEAPKSLDPIERMMYLDTITYLPSDILCKVDRASMSASLETRAPFLDNELAELVWNLPVDVKIHRGIGKWPVREVLKRYVPSALFERPKTGFGIPIGDWLRGPLREWAEEALSEKHLESDGFFNAKVVRTQWLTHLSGRSNVQHSLWSVLMFQAWLKAH